MQNFAEFLSGRKIPKPLTPKAKWYIDRYPDINKAFNEARCEDPYTLNSLYAEGVDINYDISASNKCNMFNCSITAHTVCNPYFLELMFKHRRKDIYTDGQKVFEMACAFGDAHHIAIFVKYRDEYKIDIILGMRSAVSHRNRDNLHHLLIYQSPKKEEISELWDIACGFSSDVPMLLYMIKFFECTITEEKLIECMPYNFYETFTVLINLYLREGKPFNITTEILQNILKGTNDRMIKLDFLSEKGFEIEYLENIKNTDENELPKPSMSRYYTNAF